MRSIFYYLIAFTCITGLLISCAKPSEACFSFLPTNNITTSTKVTFDASCSNSGAYSYNWDFGDGTPDTLLLGVSKVNHTFNKSGTFTVSLIVERKDGVVWREKGKYNTTRTITVQ
jgi:PKD repeat protein